MLVGKIFRCYEPGWTRWWCATCDPIRVYTQGRSKRDAMAMLADAAQLVVESQTQQDVRLWVDELEPLERNAFAVSIAADRPYLLFATVLRQQRGFTDLTEDEVAARLGGDLDYAAIERGRVLAPIDRLDEILAVAAPDLVIRVGSRDDLINLGASASMRNDRGRRDPRKLRASRSDLRAR